MIMQNGDDTTMIRPNQIYAWLATFQVASKDQGGERTLTSLPGTKLLTPRGFGAFQPDHKGRISQYMLGIPKRIGRAYHQERYGVLSWVPLPLDDG